MLQVLQQNFRVFTNNSCGLHVHVGNREWGFPRRTLKTFAQLVTVWERQLASLHPGHRINNVHCRAPSSNFCDTDLVKNVLILQDAKSTKALIKVMSFNPYGAGRGFAYNMKNLIDKGLKATIEFRQHEAIFDVPAIAAWASLACRLVEKCHYISHTDFISLVVQGVSPDAPNILELLNALGLGDLAAYYAQSALYEHPQPTGLQAYEGQAYVQEPVADVEMADNDSNASSELSDIDEPVGIKHLLPTSKKQPQPDTAGDEDYARRLYFALRNGKIPSGELRNPQLRKMKQIGKRSLHYKTLS